jgi:hypothetical protein
VHVQDPDPPTNPIPRRSEKPGEPEAVRDRHVRVRKQASRTAGPSEVANDVASDASPTGQQGQSSVRHPVDRRSAGEIGVVRADHDHLVSSVGEDLGQLPPDLLDGAARGGRRRLEWSQHDGDAHLDSGSRHRNRISTS